MFDLVEFGSLLESSVHLTFRSTCDEHDSGFVISCNAFSILAGSSRLVIFAPAMAS